MFHNVTSNSVSSITQDQVLTNTEAGFDVNFYYYHCTT